jgi:integrase
MTEIIPYKDPFSMIDQQLRKDPQLGSENSRKTYKLAINQFYKWLDGRDFKKTVVEDFISSLQERDQAPSTINLKLSAIRWYARRVSEYIQDVNPPAGSGVMEFENFRDELIRHLSRVASIPDIKGERVRPGRSIKDGEFSALMKSCMDDESPAGARDAAIIALAALTGMRRAEIVALDLDDFQKETEGEEGTIKIRGKGNHERIGYVYNGAALALADWLALRGSESGPLFLAINKGGALQRGHRLSVRALHKILHKRWTQAGLKKLTSHDLRRTFASNLLDSGVDRATVQVLMGHASPVTTSIYDRRDERVRRKAVQKLFIPYSRRFSPAHH